MIEPLFLVQKSTTSSVFFQNQRNENDKMDLSNYYKTKECENVNGNLEQVLKEEKSGNDVMERLNYTNSLSKTNLMKLLFLIV